MPNAIPRDELEVRLETLELLMRRVLLIVGTAGTMLSEVRHGDEDGQRCSRPPTGRVFKP